MNDYSIIRPTMSPNVTKSVFIDTNSRETSNQYGYYEQNHYQYDDNDSIDDYEENDIIYNLPNANDYYGSLN